jgi:4-methylaminobutanoate oxidase (formaldehyde-forming)
MQELGAVFGTKQGWERPDYFEPGRPWRRAGADQRGFGWTRPPYFDALQREHQAFRERVGIIDMCSFGKVEVHGPGALGLLERVAGNRIDRTIGSVVYTQLLEHDGGIAADVTITRLSTDHFRLVTGAGYVNSDLGWLRMQLGAHDQAVHLRESSEELSVIGMWGPHARRVMEQVTQDDVSPETFPYGTARDLRIGAASVFAQRVSYVGELGWEMYVDPGWTVQVWDRLMDAGRQSGITPGGYRVLDSLRMEKGYRYYGTDMGLLDNPSFNGREALVAAKQAGIARRLRTLAVGDAAYVPIYGGEAVHDAGRVVGRLRSCAYGFTVRKNLAYAYLPPSYTPGARVAVEVFGDMVPAAVMQDRVLSARGQLAG